jgi:hypothetical protein
MDTSPRSPEAQSRRKLSYWLFAIGCLLVVITFFFNINHNAPGIASRILGFFLLILGILYRFTTSGGRKPGRDLLFWTPRVLILGAAVFVGGFVIDNVFHGRSDFWPALPILLGALMPSYLMLLLLVISWRKDWLGGTLCIVGAVLFNFLYGPPGRSIVSFNLLISAPFLFLAMLFLLSWYLNRGATGNRSIGGTIS